MVSEDANPNPNDGPNPNLNDGPNSNLNPNHDLDHPNPSAIITLDSITELPDIKFIIDLFLESRDSKIRKAAYDALFKAKERLSDDDGLNLGFIEEMYFVLASADGDSARISQHHTEAVRLYQQASVYPKAIQYPITKLIHEGSFLSLLTDLERFIQQSTGEKIIGVAAPLPLAHEEDSASDEEIGSSIITPEPNLKLTKIYEMVFERASNRVIVSDDFGIQGMTYISLTGEGFDNGGLRAFTDLWSLCGSDDHLLTISHPIKHPADGFDALVVEEVLSFREFCDDVKEEFYKSKDHSISDWWPFIKDIFTPLFRGISEGLIFLYLNKNRACGNLSRSIYINKQTIAKILPALGGGHQKEGDMHALIGLMTEFLMGPFDGKNIEDAEFEFPADLLSFFKFEFETKGRLPPEFRLSHPFFLSDSKNYKFPELLKNTLNRLPTRMPLLDRFLVNETLFCYWASKLTNPLYKAIWDLGDPSFRRSATDVKTILSLKGVTVAPYADNVSIVRYVCSAVHHANDGMYRIHRGPKVMTQEDVLSDLFTIFPGYNTIMFESVGRSVILKGLDQKILEELYKDSS